VSAPQQLCPKPGGLDLPAASPERSATPAAGTASAGVAALLRVGLVVAVVDQATKTAAHELAPPGAWGWLRPVHNPDVVLSMYSGTAAFLVVIGLAALIGFSVHLWHLARQGILPGWAAGLLVGGAASNLADRLVQGAVRDWRALPWVVANLADLAVAVGAVCYLAAGARWAMAGWAAPSTGAPAAG
jgi:signal peptidase II